MLGSSHCHRSCHQCLIRATSLLPCSRLSLSSTSPNPTDDLILLYVGLKLACLSLSLAVTGLFNLWGCACEQRQQTSEISHWLELAVSLSRNYCASEQFLQPIIYNWTFFPTPQQNPLKEIIKSHTSFLLMLFVHLHPSFSPALLWKWISLICWRRGADLLPKSSPKSSISCQLSFTTFPFGTMGSERDKRNGFWDSQRALKVQISG